MRRTTWILDTLAILLSLCVIVFLATRRPGGNAAYVRIQSRDGVYQYPLSTDRTISVMGPLGPTVIQIKDGQVMFLSSPCPGQDCVHHAPLSQDGAFNACLPNQVLVTIESQGEVDDVTT